MIAQLQQTFRRRSAVGGDQATVTIAAEVLAREKAEAAESAGAPCLNAANMCAEGLGTVLDQQEQMVFRQLCQGRHIGRLAEQMYRKNRAGARCNGCSDGFRVDIECARINVDENRLSANVTDGLGGCNEGEGCGDHLVARAKIGCTQRQMQCISARGAGHRVSHPEVVGEFRFQRLHVRTENETRALEDFGDGRIDGSTQIMILALKIDHWNHC